MNGNKPMESILYGAMLFLTIFFAAWNVIDEYYILQSWMIVTTVVLAWLVIPGLNALLCIGSKKATLKRACRVLLFIFPLVFAFYALDGSSGSNEDGYGPRHEHLYTVPFLLITLYCPAVVSVDLVERARRIKAPWNKKLF